jgi:archaellum component FlaC
MGYEKKIAGHINRNNTPFGISLVLFGADADKEISELKNQLANANRKLGGMVNIPESIRTLNERITKYEQNLGAVNMYLNRSEYTKASIESNRFINELDADDAKQCLKSKPEGE